MVWSQLARIRTPPIVTSDFLYVRFIGDRSIDEKDFGRIQKDRILEMNKWAEEIKKVETEKERGRKEVSLAMIAASNHYADNYDNNVKVINKLANQTFIQKIPRNNSKIGKVISQNS